MSLFSRSRECPAQILAVMIWRFYKRESCAEWNVGPGARKIGLRLGDDMCVCVRKYRQEANYQLPLDYFIVVQI